MKTYLDTIVEEELGKGDEWAKLKSDETLTDWIDRIMRHVRKANEASFRHGVEMGLLSHEHKCSLVCMYAGLLAAVQPAPAEEKPEICPRRTLKCWCRRERWAEKLHPDDRKRLAHGDARHGERRKAQACGECGRAYAYQWGRIPDRRRSNSDRRKP